MPVQIQHQPDDISVLRIGGILKRSEFAAEQSALARAIDIGSKPRLLVILEDFEGWQRGADWNDLDFLISQGGKISKIAIVARHKEGYRGASSRLPKIARNDSASTKVIIRAKSACLPCNTSLEVMAPSPSGKKIQYGNPDKSRNEAK